MAVLVQEASDLVHICEDLEFSVRLAAAGLAKSRVVELRARVAEAQRATSVWVTLRGETCREEHEEVRSRAIRLLARLRAAARFHLRGDPEEKLLTAREPGRSREVLAQHLREVARLFELSANRFVADSSLGATDAAEEALDIALELESLPNLALQRAERADARRKRDSAFASLREMVSQVRAAARYVFHGEPALKRRFASAYERRLRSEARAVRQAARHQKEHAPHRGSTRAKREEEGADEGSGELIQK